jgi:hypothetical protein
MLLSEQALRGDGACGGDGGDGASGGDGGDGASGADDPIFETVSLLVRHSEREHHHEP